MNYKNAFKCKKCPQRNDEEGCPNWWEFVATDVSTGKITNKKGCGYQLQLHVMIEIIKCANGAQVAAEQARNTVSTYVENSVRLKKKLLKYIPAAQGTDSELLLKLGD